MKFDIIHVIFFIDRYVDGEQNNRELCKNAKFTHITNVQGILYVSLSLENYSKEEPFCKFIIIFYSSEKLQKYF